MEPASDIRKIAFLGDFLPRKCGIVMFTSNVLSAVRREFLRAQTWSWTKWEAKGKAGE